MLEMATAGKFLSNIYIYQIAGVKCNFYVSTASIRRYQFCSSCSCLEESYFIYIPIQFSILRWALFILISFWIYGSYLCFNPRPPSQQRVHLEQNVHAAMLRNRFIDRLCIFKRAVNKLRSHRRRPWEEINN